MAFHNGNKVGPFKRDHWNQIQQNLVAAWKKSLQMIPAHGLTRHDIVELAIRPSDLSTLARATQLTGGNDDGFYTTQRVEPQPGVGFTLNSVYVIARGQPNMLFPQYVRNGLIVQEATQGVYQRFVDFVTEYTRITHQWMMVREVLNELTYKCAKPEQFAFFVPNVANLFYADWSEDPIHQVGQKLRKVGVPSKIPGVQHALRQCCNQANATLALAQMLPEGGMVREDVTLRVTRVPGFVLPWKDGDDKLATEWTEDA